MLIPKTVLVMTCGAALTTSALAQEQVAAFEYWPVARQLRSGQFQAEVWRHDLRDDHNDLAWSNQEPFATPAIAIAEACTSVRKSFDPSFSCSRITHQTSASDRAASNHGTVVVAKKIAVTSVESKVTAAKGPVNPSGIAKGPVSSGERRAWLNDFWKVQERQSGGSSGGGGGGGGDK